MTDFSKNSIVFDKANNPVPPDKSTQLKVFFDGNELKKIDFAGNTSSLAAKELKVATTAAVEVIEEDATTYTLRIPSPNAKIQELKSSLIMLLAANANASKAAISDVKAALSDYISEHEALHGTVHAAMRDMEAAVEKLRKSKSPTEETLSDFVRTMTARIEALRAPTIVSDSTNVTINYRPSENEVGIEVDIPKLAKQVVNYGGGGTSQQWVIDYVDAAVENISGGGGTPGPIGPQGPQGIMGVAGVAGISGAQGAQGIQGIMGGSVSISGSGSIGGSIALNQIAVGIGADAISGSSAFVFDGTTMSIAPMSGSGRLIITNGLTPSLILGAPDKSQVYYSSLSYSPSGSVEMADQLALYAKASNGMGFSIDNTSGHFRFGTYAQGETFRIFNDGGVQVGGTFGASPGYGKIKAGITVITENIVLPVTSSTGVNGIIYLGAQRWMHARGGAGYESIFLGASSGNLTLSGSDNVGVGQFTLSSLTTGSLNSAIGKGAGEKVTTGTSNSALGFWALKNVTTSSGNTAIGSQALDGITIGGYNTAIGSYAAQTAVSTSHLATVGTGSLYNATGNGNTAIGYEAGQAITTGEYNSFVGWQSGKTGPATISRSTAIGYLATVNVSDAIVLGRVNVSTKVGVNVASPAFTLDIGGTLHTEGNVIINDMIRMGSSIASTTEYKADGVINIAATATVDMFTPATSATFGSVSYEVAMSNGTSMRKSIVEVAYMGTSTDFTEYSILEIGGAYSGATWSVTSSGSNVILQLVRTSGTHAVKYNRRLIF